MIRRESDNVRGLCYLIRKNTQTLPIVCMSICLKVTFYIDTDVAWLPSVLALKCAVYSVKARNFSFLLSTVDNILPIHSKDVSQKLNEIKWSLNQYGSYTSGYQCNTYWTLTSGSFTSLLKFVCQKSTRVE